MLKIKQTKLAYQPEPLIHALGFKGGNLTELWQVSCTIETDSGLSATGYGVQSVLWSDSGIFTQFGQHAGNELMLQITQYALSCLENTVLTTPPELLRQILPDVLRYAKQISGYPDLRTTFVLNALTPVDWALWRLYQKANPTENFESLTAPFTHYLNHRQDRLGNIPLISYDTPESQIRQLAEEGRFFFKIKIGSNPGGRNDLDEMLEQDVRRFRQIHNILKDYRTDFTDCGHPAYYFDANGRYDSRDRVLRFLEQVDKEDALNRVLLLEEPFPEDALASVHDLPVAVAGDESAHSEEDAIRLIEEYGFQTIALKPIAKTLSISLAVLEEAGKRGIPCFCADLTVNPQMVEINKCFASRLSTLKGLKTGVFESNGSQNYRNWQRMMETSGYARKNWAIMQKGLFELDEAYYRCDGGIWTN